MSPKPFPVVVDLLEQCVYTFWSNKTAYIQIIGSLALRAHLSPSLKQALSTGIVDIDLLVSVDPSIFDALGVECFIYLQRILAHHGLSSDTLQYRSKPAHGSPILKYYWHEFRFADIQLVSQEKASYKSCLKPVFPSLSCHVATLESLQEQSESVMRGDFDQFPGDNAWRKQKDQSRLAALSTSSLWHESAVQSSDTGRLIAEKRLVESFA
jgi:hypothetical protein